MEPKATKGQPATPAVKFFQLVPNNLRVDYLRWRWWAFILSWAVILAGAVVFAVKGMNYGIDFTGGTVVQVQVKEQADIAKMRDTLAAGNIGPFTLQSLGGGDGNEYLVQLGSFLTTGVAASGESLAKRVETLLKAQYPSLTVRRVESVGPKVGEELKRDAVYAILLSLVAILAYMSIRFQWRDAVGALVSTAHDVLFVLALFAMTQKEINLTVVAAILTVAGYSVNDTVVVFDRIRENLRHHLKMPLMQLMNESINQTLSRTVLTGGSVLMVLIVMFFWGGETLHDFAFALVVGIVVGTYSSIFQAAPVSWLLHQWFPRRIA